MKHIFTKFLGLTLFMVALFTAQSASALSNVHWYKGYNKVVVNQSDAGYVYTGGGNLIANPFTNDSVVSVSKALANQLEEHINSATASSSAEAVTTDEDPTTGATMPFHMAAAPREGYVFVGWQNAAGETISQEQFVTTTIHTTNYLGYAQQAPAEDPAAAIDGYYDAIFTAVFEPDVSTAVVTVSADRAVAGVTYVNAAGQVANKPFQGMNIVVTRYADGTTSTTKVIK